MKLIALMGLILIAAAPALAEQNAGVLYTGEMTGEGTGSDARETLVDAWNDTQTPLSGWTYAASIFGFAYTPASDYTLNRVEFYAGGAAGTVTVSILADSGSGLPDGAVLASATYGEVADRQWQGADLDSPVALTGGTLYYIRYDVVVGAELSHADSGVAIPHFWNYGSSWEGPSSLFYWMARFYGDVTTPASTLLRSS